MNYHMVVTRKQVLVQLDHELVERLDRLAHELGTNRSDLLRRGAWVVLRAADLKDADAKMQEAYRRVPQEAWLIEAADQLALETMPEW
jgi:metal-responsive CopG/Arc/MetJ family transcriptional regulator